MHFNIPIWGALLAELCYKPLIVHLYSLWSQSCAKISFVQYLFCYVKIEKRHTLNFFKTDTYKETFIIWQILHTMIDIFFHLLTDIRRKKNGFNILLYFVLKSVQETANSINNFCKEQKHSVQEILKYWHKLIIFFFFIELKLFN